MYKYIHLLREKRRQASHHTTNSNFFEEQVRGLVISYFSITALKSWNYNWFQLTFPWDFSAFFQINIFTCLNLLFIQGKLIILYREPKWSKSHSVMSNSLQPNGIYSPWNSPGQNTGVVALPFSRGSSLPRGQTLVSRIAGRFFTSWATREAQAYWSG